MSTTLCPSHVDVSNLRLASAIQLLRQAGHTLPADVPADPREATGWLQSMIDSLCDLSSKDALTGLANRRQFESVLEREIDRVARIGEPALVLLVDIDHFKRVNDAYGHPAGDQVLKHVAGMLLECVRPMDTVARFGGEEFAIILPNCQPGFGSTVAERLRRCVEHRAIAVAPSEQVPVTISIGGAFAPQWVRSSTTLWIERADRQLYRAKAEGRNRVCLEPLPVSSVSAEEKGMLFGISLFQDLE